MKRQTTPATTGKKRPKPTERPTFHWTEWKGKKVVIKQKEFATEAARDEFASALAGKPSFIDRKIVIVVTCDKCGIVDTDCRDRAQANRCGISHVKEPNHSQHRCTVTCEGDPRAPGAEKTLAEQCIDDNEDYSGMSDEEYAAYLKRYTKALSKFLRTQSPKPTRAPAAPAKRR